MSRLISQTRSAAALICRSLAALRSCRESPLRAASAAAPRALLPIITVMNGVNAASESSGHSPMSAFLFLRVATSRPGSERNAIPFGPLTRSVPVI